MTGPDVFTGIVEERGTLAGVEPLDGEAARVWVSGPRVTADAAIGDSIAVNGVCLTIADLDGGTFAADVMRETLRCTTLGATSAGDPVNLERAMRPDGRFGGHLVTGHVDAVGTVASRTRAPHWESVRIEIPHLLAPLLAPKGSVAVDGVSLTVTRVGDGPPAWFEVSLIPVTLGQTTLGERPEGSQVNLEADIIARYVQRVLTAPRSETGARS